MKRVLTILLGVVLAIAGADAQLQSIGGDLRYQYDYQDILSEDHLSVNTHSSPIFDLGLTGIVLSPQVLSFYVRSSLNLNFGRTHSGTYSQSSHQSYWDTYDAAFDFFRFSPIKFQIAARDYISTISTTYNNGVGYETKTRNQEQRANLSVDKIAFLPTMTFRYSQARIWSLTDVPSAQTNRQFSFALATAAGAASSMNLSGSVVTITDRYSGYDETNSTVQFTGARELAPDHRVETNVEYDRFNDYGTLYGSLGYGGALSPAVRISSGISGAQTNSTVTSYRNVGVYQSFNVAAGNALRFGLSLNGATGRYVSLADQSVSSVGSFGTGISMNHSRALSGWTVTNSLTAGYSVRDYGAIYRVWEAALSNSVTTGIGSFNITGNYDVALQTTRNGLSWSSLNQNASAIATGVLPENIRSQSTLRIRLEDYSGDLPFNRNLHSFGLAEGLETRKQYGIPMSFGLGGSITWYTSSLVGHTYGWYLSFVSTSFFVRGMYVSYRYARTFDPYFQREVIEHNGSLDYTWRALILHAEIRHSSAINRVRDLTFTITRPF